MTRINVVPPSILADQHLLAEYRELPRVIPLAARAEDHSGPESYTLGKGHVRFFYPRTGWLAERQRALMAELLDRGYSLTHREPLVPLAGAVDWTPTAEAVTLNLARLDERLRSRVSYYTHRGVQVLPDFYARVRVDPAWMGGA